MICGTMMDYFDDFHDFGFKIGSSSPKLTEPACKVGLMISVALDHAAGLPKLDCLLESPSLLLD